MKGIILAGGTGSRLFPITKGVSKQLLPIYDKPMIYYPLSVIMSAGINQVLLISTPLDLPSYKRLLGDGSSYGLDLKYAEQNEPNGLAEAFIIGENFMGNDPVCMILGDNIFYGKGLDILMKKAIESSKEATVFGYKVKDPQRHGVIEFDSNGNLISIEEKPEKPKSDKALVGLYFYPNEVIQIAKNVLPSKRGELEISSVNQVFLERGILNAKILDEDFLWLDTGTHESLIEAGQFVHTIEKRQGIKIACLEEIAFKKGWISHKELLSRANSLSMTEYGQFLLKKYKI